MVIAMRVVVRTPAEVQAQYDLPELEDTADDDAVIDAVQHAKPVGKSAVHITGRPYVFARVVTLDALSESGARLMAAEARLQEERAAAQELARRFFDEGMAKSAIAATLGITRPTLDSWLAKSEPPRRRR